MHYRYFFICTLLIMATSFSALAQNTATLQAGSPKQTISKHIYGHFAEHLGRSIYDGFYVGEKNTTIPHTAGVRNDVIAALKKLKIPNLRWPGGCFADTYHWKDGIGPKAVTAFDCEYLVGWRYRRQFVWYARFFEYV